MRKDKSYINFPQKLNAGGRLIDISTPLIMGILNVTPDSFFDGGKYTNEDAILSRVEQMIQDGADIIDIGAYSSRPGAKHISEEEELERLNTVLASIRANYPEIIISVDTFRASVAACVVNEFKVDIINDISAGDMDEKMFETIARLNVPYIIMHMKGTPQNMQVNPNYEKDIVFEVIDYLAEKKRQLSLLGVHDVIIDPGFGFGKTLDHNYQLLNRLDDLRLLELPILVGVSRKSMIYKLLETSPEEALNGTTALNMVALERGAGILRVHDVKEAKDCISIFNKLQQ
ncbi:dihydropteroate synthase [Labilibacter marinus]|uniref:dihydropteroate synthase n=1 Tax=Labilibacter marinus TaxID=1477105 RepID=UPI00095008F9|nr:dihydropteroate synthase [Labilibacter marinus]